MAAILAAWLILPERAWVSKSTPVCRGHRADGTRFRGCWTIDVAGTQSVLDTGPLARGEWDDRRQMCGRPGVSSHLRFVRALAVPAQEREVGGNVLAPAPTTGSGIENYKNGLVVTHGIACHGLRELRSSRILGRSERRPVSCNGQASTSASRSLSHQGVVTEVELAGSVLTA